jgi:hypothetical protein
MNSDRLLKELFDIIRDEARQNPRFGERLAMALTGVVAQAPPRDRGRVVGEQDTCDTAAPAKETKRGNRRAAAVIDPITEMQHGENRLRELLAPLDLERLRDVVAEYRMDPNKLVMKWKDRERIIDHIVTTSASRGRKGDAFRA